MRVGSFLTTSVFLLVTLSGCVAEDAEPATGDTPTIVITDPGDYTYVDNETTRDVAHLHDYWGSQTQLEIIARGDAGTTWSGDANMLGPIEPVDGVFPLGTGRVEATVEWEHDIDDRYDHMELWVKTANETEPFLLGPVSNGETVTFEVTNDQADLPHQTLSSWHYQLQAFRTEGEPFILYRGEITVHSIAYKTLEIPLFPGHNDRWANETRLDVLHDAHDAFIANSERDGGMCLRENETGGTSCFYEHVPNDGRVIPHDADYVEVYVTEDAEHESMTLWLAYRHAASREWVDLREPDRIDGNTDVYVIPVVGSMGDGPYARQSQWLLRMVTEDATGLDLYRGGYTIDASAFKSA